MALPAPSLVSLEPVFAMDIDRHDSTFDSSTTALGSVAEQSSHRHVQIVSKTSWASNAGLNLRPSECSETTVASDGLKLQAFDEHPEEQAERSERVTERPAEAPPAPELPSCTWLRAQTGEALEALATRADPLAATSSRPSCRGCKRVLGWRLQFRDANMERGFRDLWSARSLVRFRWVVAGIALTSALHMIRLTHFGLPVRDPVSICTLLCTACAALGFAASFVPFIVRLCARSPAWRCNLLSSVITFSICSLLGRVPHDSGPKELLNFVILMIYMLLVAMNLPLRGTLPYLLLNTIMILATHLPGPRNPRQYFCIAILLGNALAFVSAYIIEEQARRNFLLSRIVENARTAAERANTRSAAILHNLLPPEIVSALKRGDTNSLNRWHESVSVVFVAIEEGPAAAAGDLPALIARTNGVMRELEGLAEAHGVQKIKTVGHDVFMAVAGLSSSSPEEAEEPAPGPPTPAWPRASRRYSSGSLPLPGGPKRRSPPAPASHSSAHLSHAERAASFACAAALAAESAAAGLRIRVGLHTGPVVAGILGSRLFYDVFGDTVNVAQRMCATAEPGALHATAFFRDRLLAACGPAGPACCDVSPEGVVEVKGKGRMRTCALRPRGAAGGGGGPLPPSPKAQEARPAELEEGPSAEPWVRRRLSAAPKRSGVVPWPPAEAFADLESATAAAGPPQPLGEPRPARRHRPARRLSSVALRVLRRASRHHSRRLASHNVSGSSFGGVPDLEEEAATPVPPSLPARLRAALSGPKPFSDASQEADFWARRRGYLFPARALLVHMLLVIMLFTVVQVGLYAPHVADRVLSRCGLITPALFVALVLARFRLFVTRHRIVAHAALLCFVAGLGLYWIHDLVIGAPDIVRSVSNGDATVAFIFVSNVFAIPWFEVQPYNAILFGLSFANMLFPLSAAPLVHFATAVTCAVCGYVREVDARKGYELDAQAARETERLMEDDADTRRLLALCVPASVLANLSPAKGQCDPGYAKGDRLLSDVVASAALGFPRVVVLYTDVVGFTGLASRLEPASLVAALDGIFVRCDEIARKHGLETLKTIGDAWMGVAGLSGAGAGPSEARAALAAAREMVAAYGAVRLAEGEEGLQVRVGVAVGRAAGAIVGAARWQWDLFGEAVDEAVAAEERSTPGRIRVTPAAAALATAANGGIVFEEGREGSIYLV